MMLETIPLAIPGLVLIRPKVFGDARGHFYESFQSIKYEALGLNEAFVQDNVSVSTRGVLRGLHLQHPQGQGKLIHVIQGRILDVAVDVRVGSPNFGQQVQIELSGDDHQQLYIPEGFAHGFVALEDKTIMQYKCTKVYNPECEISIQWNDPRLGISWPDMPVTLSPKDRAGISLEDARSQGRLPFYSASLT